MNEHVWLGLGLADMSQGQAEEWAEAQGRSVRTPLAVFVRTLVCVRCGQAFGIEGECQGMLFVDPWEELRPDLDPRTLHQWMTLLNVLMSEEEAADWASGEGLELELSPRSIALVCSLCGQAYDEADTACPERVLANLEAGDEPE